jgi:hypothetical protein
MKSSKQYNNKLSTCPQDLRKTFLILRDQPCFPYTSYIVGNLRTLKHWGVRLLYTDATSHATLYNTSDLFPSAIPLVKDEWLNDESDSVQKSNTVAKNMKCMLCRTVTVNL